MFIRKTCWRRWGECAVPSHVVRGSCLLSIPMKRKRVVPVGQPWGMANVGEGVQGFWWWSGGGQGVVGLCRLRPGCKQSSAGRRQGSLPGGLR